MIQRPTQACGQRNRYLWLGFVISFSFASLQLLGPAWAEGGVRHAIPTSEQRAANSYWSKARVEAAVRNGSPVDRRFDAPSPSSLRHTPTPPGWRNPAIGKILYREKGIPYSCTGTVINTKSRRLVLTAAHCLLFDRWSRYVRFIPDYERGRRPYGVRSVRNLWVTKGWWRRENPNYDIGLAVLRSRVGDSTGALDYEPYPRRKGFTRIFGYPAGKMRGERQRVCSSRTWAGDFLSLRLPGPNGMAAWCNMAGGSSGGPWLSEYKNKDDPTKPFWVLDGITSRGYKGRMTSPYLGRQFVQMVRQAQR